MAKYRRKTWLPAIKPTKVVPDRQRILWLAQRGGFKWFDAVGGRSVKTEQDKDSTSPVPLDNLVDIAVNGTEQAMAGGLMVSRG